MSAEYHSLFRCIDSASNSILALMSAFFLESRLSDPRNFRIASLCLFRKSRLFTHICILVDAILCYKKNSYPEFARLVDGPGVGDSDLSAFHVLRVELGDAISFPLDKGKMVARRLEHAKGS